jgi:hypothetical protein
MAERRVARCLAWELVVAVQLVAQAWHIGNKSDDLGSKDDSDSKDDLASFPWRQ